MIDDAIILAFLGMAFAFLYMAMQNKEGTREQTMFRMLFVSLALGALYGMFAVAAAFLLGYTVPAANTQAYYAQTQITANANLMYVFGWIIVISWIFYLAIEIIIYFGRVAAMVRQKKDNPYDQG